VSLQKLNPGPERNLIDQRLSRAIDKHDTFTHKSLCDFEHAADEIFSDIGEWAADWYIQQVCKQAASTGDMFPEFSFSLSFFFWITFEAYAIPLTREQTGLTTTRDPR
jgi:hypothetical protein